MALLVFLLGFLNIASAQNVEKPKPFPVIAYSHSYAYAFPGGEVLRVDPDHSFALGLVHPLDKDLNWALYYEAGIHTPFDENRPGAQAATGASRKISDRLRFGTAGLAKFTPGYDEGDPTLVVGGTFVPILSFDWLSLWFPVAVGWNVSTDTPVLAAAPKVTLKL